MIELWRGNVRSLTYRQMSGKQFSPLCVRCKSGRGPKVFMPKPILDEATPEKYEPEKSEPGKSRPDNATPATPATPKPAYTTFAGWVREVLARLYDSPYLETHPLALYLVRDDSRYQPRSQRLRERVIETVRAMRPGANVPAHSPDWRAYRILELRYLDGLTPAEIMDEIALGRSRYFEEQARVLEAFTQRLWAHRPPPETQNLVQNVEAEDAHAGENPARDELAQREVARLEAQPSWEMLDVGRALDELQPVIATLLQLHGGVLTRDPELTCRIHGDRVMLRQVLLNLLSHALTHLPTGGRIHVRTPDAPASAEFSGAAVALEMVATVSATGSAMDSARFAPANTTPAGTIPADTIPADTIPIELDICAQLMAALDGALALENRPGFWRARLTWPQPETRTLLVVDDNQDFLELFRRYLDGQGWEVVGAPDGRAARERLAETQPTVITLDVMMPREDGWEFLRSLQTDSATRAIPVIVCSVLSEPRLALALGAADFLAKPVSQRALRQALARWH